MPGTFSFSGNFDEADIVSQAAFTKGTGPGIDDPTRFSVQGADFLFHNNDVSIIGIALYAGQTIHLDVDYGSGGIASFNSELWVIDTDGTLRVSNNNSGTTDNGSTSLADSSLDFTASTTGVYFIAASQKDNNYVDGTFGFDNNGTDGGDFLLNMSFSTLPALRHGTGGDDVVDLTPSERRYAARGGDDAIRAGDFSARIDGGRGDDYIQGDYSHAHSDQISGGAGSDTLHGYDGRDLLFGNGDDDYLYGGDGSDQLFGGTEADHLYGENGNDLLTAGPGAYDYLYGGDGRDTLYGGGGADYLNGGPGKDLISGDSGRDEVIYNDAPGAVTIDLRILDFQNTQSAGFDKLVDVEDIQGSAFSDLLEGNSATNNIYGGDGNDTLRGFGGNDGLNDYGSGNDRMFGGSGSDNLRGGLGKDTLRGNIGNDYIYGGDGNNSLFGNAGSDRLVGDAGRDRLMGGGGIDFFDFNSASESAPGAADQIVDFSHVQADIIDLYDVYAGTLTFIGPNPFSGAPGEVRVHTLASGLQAVDVNLDAVVGTNEMRILVDSATVLLTGDFYL